jgi:hypothetical protein
MQHDSTQHMCPIVASNRKIGTTLARSNQQSVVVAACPAPMPYRSAQAVPCDYWGGLYDLAINCSHEQHENSSMPVLQLPICRETGQVRTGNQLGSASGLVFGTVAISARPCRLGLVQLGCEEQRMRRGKPIREALLQNNAVHESWREWPSGQYGPT